MPPPPPSELGSGRGTPTDSFRPGGGGASGGDYGAGHSGPCGQQVPKDGSCRFTGCATYEEIADYEELGVPYRKPVEAWTAEEVAAWLGAALQLEAVAAAFRARGVDGAVLLEVDHEVLRDDLGMASKLERIRVLTARDRLPVHRAAAAGAEDGPAASEPGLPRSPSAASDGPLPALPEMPYSTTEGRNYVTVAPDRAVPFAPDGDGYDMPEAGRK